MQAAVVGARGFLGRELVRLLIDHPAVDAVLPISRNASAEPFGDHVPSLRHRGLVMHGMDAVDDADLVFLAAPKGVAAGLTRQAEDNGARLVVDLSRDHRAAGLEGRDGWRYGLADLDPVPRGTKRIANPGCYPTATLLGTLPALRVGLAGPGPLIADGKSGVSGAGVDPGPGFHFPVMDGSTRAYKVLGHDHTAEIRGAAENGTGPRPVRFTPHLVPQSRGLLATSYLPLADGAGQEDLTAAYEKAFQDAPFVRLVEEPDTVHVRGSNLADVAVTADPETGLLVARGAIDNLVKGGAGQAVQNMNDALGLPSTEGLHHTGGGV